MANLKTGGLPALLNALLAEAADPEDVPPAAAETKAKTGQGPATPLDI
jgi:hypothetical protein